MVFTRKTKQIVFIGTIVFTTSLLGLSFTSSNGKFNDEDWYPRLQSHREPVDKRLRAFCFLDEAQGVCRTRGPSQICDNGEKRIALRKPERTNITMTSATTKPPLIVVLAYMHTGSSFTGSIFQQHPGTYYHYEALRSLQGKSRENLSVQWLNGSHRRLQGEWVTRDVAEEAVDHMLNCKYGHLDIATLSDTHYGGARVRDQSTYKQCIDRHRRSSNISKGDTIRNCLPHLVTPCLQASLRAFKFIRLPMATVEGLMERNSELRVIHLVRDPRAMLDSQVRKGEMGSRMLSMFTSNTKRLCDKMHSDYEISKSFPVGVHRNIRLVRYEDMTGAPLEVCEGLFRFAGVRFLDHDRSFVETTTRGGNSSRLVTWRKHLSQERLDVLNKHCQPVFRDFGYVEYDDIADVRDIRKPTYVKNADRQSASRA